MATTGNYTDCEAVTVRQPEVHGWIDSLGYATERLLAMAAELEKRLAPVLGAESPAGCGNKDSEAGCPLAVSVQRGVITLNAVESRLRDILQRLEV